MVSPNIWFIIEIPMEMDDLGVSTHFRKPPDPVDIIYPLVLQFYHPRLDPMYVSSSPSKRWVAAGHLEHMEKFTWFSHPTAAEITQIFSIHISIRVVPSSFDRDKT